MKLYVHNDGRELFVSEQKTHLGDRGIEVNLPTKKAKNWLRIQQEYERLQEILRENIRS